MLFIFHGFPDSLFKIEEGISDIRRIKKESNEEEEDIEENMEKEKEENTYKLKMKVTYKDEKLFF